VCASSIPRRASRHRKLVFGFPELEPKRREELHHAMRVTNPGCYSTGFLAIARPLVRAGIIPPDWPVMCNAVSGYSGGGKSMIAEFEDASAKNYAREMFRTYGLASSTSMSTRCRRIPVSCIGRCSRPAWAASIAACWSRLRCNYGAARDSQRKKCPRRARRFLSREKLIEVASLEEAARRRLLMPRN